MENCLLVLKEVLQGLMAGDTLMVNPEGGDVQMSRGGQEIYNVKIKDWIRPPNHHCSEFWVVMSGCVALRLGLLTCNISQGAVWKCEFARK